MTPAAIHVIADIDRRIRAMGRRQFLIHLKLVRRERNDWQ